MSKNPRKTITWVAAPVPTPRPTGRLGPCDPCKVGDHHLCAKVACYRCPPVNHPRHHAAGNAEQATHARPFPAGRFEIQTLTAGDQ